MQLFKKIGSYGFTLLELLIAITIVGIIATSVTFSIRGFVVEKRSEEKVVGLWAELVSLRARAIRDNVPYLVGLQPGADTYTVYKNNDCNYDIAAAHSTEVKTAFMDDPTSTNSYLDFATTFGNGQSITNELPALVFGLGASAVAGLWSSDNSSVAGKDFQNTILFHPDEVGSINDGVFYLQNTARTNIGYAIAKLPNENSIKLFKWNGSTWYEMM